MAELPADTSNRHSEGPMTTKIEVTPPQGTDITSISQQEDSPSPQMACGAGGATNGAKSETGESTGKDVSICESSSLDDATIDATENASSQTGAKKKKKKKRWPKSRRKISGFEEYYADAPMTPMEALENKKRYDSARPFSSRIEECIQRFRARRRLDSLRTDIFNKYLFLGGIDGSQRQFTGVGQYEDRDQDLVGADPEQVRMMTAVDFIGGAGSRFYDGNDENWEVDFEAVVKGFLSRTITDWCMYDRVVIQMAADIVKNFLNYVLMQSVCPEYTSNIVAARSICDIAPTELRYIHELSSQLPGDFNRAACALFCEGQVKHLDKDENSEALVRFRLTTLVWSVSDKAKQSKRKILEASDPTTIAVISTMDQTYEVLEIERPRHKDRTMVKQQLADMKVNSNLKPTGFIRVRPAIIAHGWSNVPRPEEVDFSNAGEEELLLEDDLLAKFEIGMKMNVTVCELNVGLRFIKEVHELRVSFDTFLPQYLMADWKDPVPNERPPPSVNDPNCEEKVIGAEMVADD